MSTRRRDKLFLGTLEEFRFDFGADDVAADDAAVDDSQETLLTRPPVSTAPKAVALTADDVDQLVAASQGTGSAFFSLPSNAGTLDEAVAQFRRQVCQLVQREEKLQVDAERARAYAARTGKGRAAATE